MASTARNKPGEEKITVVENDSNAIDNLQFTYEKNKKPINTIVTLVVVAIVGYFGYTKLYQEPRNEKAATAISFAQRYFEADSFNRALNGDGQHAGFLKITKKFSGTKAANVSNYYAGICYLNMGDFKNAIKHLEEFDGKGTTLEYLSYGVLGDANMEAGNTKKGIEYYNKAAGDAANSVVTPLYLFRAGLAYEMENKLDDAKKAYARIRDEYPQSAQARDMDKYLARLGELE
ncbi:MAG: tetratricopeptide repeat protein [Sphingobacteriales bacterium]|nr:MAG: tetratricopeptide repeat protein [Sphingobacteriales bacterium]